VAAAWENGGFWGESCDEVRDGCRVGRKALRKRLLAFDFRFCSVRVRFVFFFFWEGVCHGCLCSSSFGFVFLGGSPSVLGNGKMMDVNARAAAQSHSKVGKYLLFETLGQGAFGK